MRGRRGLIVDDRPLSGVRVVDMCHFLAGPYATMVLADLGADVIKVEDPDRPDETRGVGPFFVGEMSLYFASLNLGKRSLAVRLKNADGRALLHDVVARADVLIENYRPGTLEKLGVSPAAMRAANPRLVTCSISGFGATGPRAAEAGYDYTVQALTGVMSMTGEPTGPPGKAGISYVDHSAGLAAGLAVCAALVERGRTGRGRHVDLALFDLQVSMLSYLAAWQLNAGYEAERVPSGAHPSLVPAQVFATRDGYLSIFVGNDPMWARCAAALPDARLAAAAYVTAQGRLAAKAELVAVLHEIFAGDDTAHWTAVLNAAGVACAPVNTVGEAMRDTQVVARDLVGETGHPVYGSYRHVAGPFPGLAGAAARRPAPLLGEHSLDILRELGHDAVDIDRLVAHGTVVSADP